MEQGIHRMRQFQGADLKARIDIIERTDSKKENGSFDIKKIKQKNGLFSLTEKYSGRLKIGKKGLTVNLIGEDDITIYQILSDFSITDFENNIPETARIYGENGTVKDPRTNITAGNLKDIFRGKLDKFLDSYKK